MEFTAVLAIYAAVISTVALAWNISRDVFNARRSVRLLLSVGSAIYVGEKVAGISLHLRVANASPSRQIEIVALHFEGDVVWLPPNVDGGIKPATLDETFPALLTPAKSLDLPFYLVPSVVDRFYESARHQDRRFDRAAIQGQPVTTTKCAGSSASFGRIATNPSDKPLASLGARRQLLLPVSDNYFCRCRGSKRVPPTTWRDSVTKGRLVA